MVQAVDTSTGGDAEQQCATDFDDSLHCEDFPGKRQV
jgi:hypothetical protein